MTQNTKDWLVAIGGGLVLLAFAAWFVWAMVVMVRENQECSGVPNAIVVKTASLFEPVACVQVPR